MEFLFLLLKMKPIISPALSAQLMGKLQEKEVCSDCSSDIDKVPSRCVQCSGSLLSYLMLGIQLYLDYLVVQVRPYV